MMRSVKVKALIKNSGIDYNTVVVKIKKDELVRYNDLAVTKGGMVQRSLNPDNVEISWRDGNISVPYDQQVHSSMLCFRGNNNFYIKVMTGGNLMETEELSVDF